jgi:DNA-binding NarL/FixJ family response regulator
LRGAIKAPIMIFSDRTDPVPVITLLKAGARGYLQKSASEAFLIDSLLDVQKGFTPLSPKVATHVLDVALSRQFSNFPDLNVKPREVELIKQLSRGLTKKEISKRAGRSVHTIDNQIRRLYGKLGAGNLGEAVGNAFRLGILD